MVQPLIRMVVLCVQVFAAGGFAAAQVALGFVIQQHGAYLLPKAGGQVLQANMPSQPFFQRYAAHRRFMRAVLAGRAPAWYNTFRTNIFFKC